MERRRLGENVPEVGVLGLGCWAFGGGQYWGDQAQADVNAVVSRALEADMNYFDTAEAYNNGASETAVGIALEGRRSGVVVGTKISPSNTTPEILRAHCEASLQRLKVDCIDLYMVHWPITSMGVKHFTDDPIIIKEPPSTPLAFETLMELQEEGKIRLIGVSNFGVSQLEEALATGAKITVNQLAYNLLCRGIEPEILPYCLRYGIGVIGYMGLHQGILTGKYESFDEIPPSRLRTRHFSASRGGRHGEAGFEAETLSALSGIRAVAEEMDVPIGQLAIAWAMAATGISCVLVGARNVEQLEDNLAATSIHLSRKVLTDLDRATRPLLEALGPNPDYYEAAGDSRIR